MSGTQPCVSIGLPVHDGERFLEEALNSLLAQEFTDFELIVSDNGSTDGTEAICRRYTKRDRRIRYHRHAENRGAAWNFNFVFHQAGGKYFKWAAHDDTCAPTFLSRCVRALDRAPPSVVACYTRAMIADEDTNVIRQQDRYPSLQSDRAHERLREVVVYFSAFPTPVFGVVRTDALARTRLVGAYVASDWILLAELALAGKLIEIPEYLFVQRAHAGMSTRANPTDADLAAWFDPARAGQRQRKIPAVYAVGRRIFVKYLTAIARSDLTAAEKARCCSALLGAWLQRRAVVKAHLSGQAP